MEIIDEEEEEAENSKILQTPQKKGPLIHQKPYFSPEIKKTLPPLNGGDSQSNFIEESVYSRDNKRSQDSQSIGRPPSQSVKMKLYHINLEKCSQTMKGTNLISAVKVNLKNGSVSRIANHQFKE